MIPYGKQFIDEDDIQAVVEILRSDWLTTGPKVAEFESAFANYVGAKEAVAVSSGTAALHASMYALGIGPGDEVIVPAITFVATANCVVFLGGKPVFCDVDAGSLLIDPSLLEAKVTPRTKAVIAVDYTGQPCDYDAILKTTRKHGLYLAADSCHALGGEYMGKKVGTIADVTAFSFHPVKHITTGEGGMVVTNDSKLADRMRLFRNHGINIDYRQREENGTWFYELVDLGFNYRLTDIQCALGMSQLKKLPKWIERRTQIAKKYDQAFAEIDEIEPLQVRENVKHAYHLYVVRLSDEIEKARVFKKLRESDIGVNVHYIPVHLHPYYRKAFGTNPGLCPIAEGAYEKILSLPIFPAMTEENVESVIESVKKVFEEIRRLWDQ